MKNIILASLALIGASAPAFAADLPRYNQEPAAPAYIAPAGFNWTGLYAGVNIGYGFSGKFSNNFTSPTSSLGSATGFSGGVQLGYNYQYDPLVFGIEGEMNYVGISDSTSTQNRKGSLSWKGALTPRVGFAMDRFLPFVKGGLAFANMDLKNTSGSDSNMLYGWTVGAGVEYAITNNVTVKLEYDYTSLAKDTFTLGGTPIKAGYSGSEIKSGLNYKF